MSDLRPLGEIAARTAMLEVACSRCERRGRYRLDRLIARHGAEAGARLEGLLLTDGLEILCNRLLELCFVLGDEPRHAAKLRRARRWHRDEERHGCGGGRMNPRPGLGRGRERPPISLHSGSLGRVSSAANRSQQARCRDVRMSTATGWRADDTDFWQSALRRACNAPPSS